MGFTAGFFLKDPSPAAGLFPWPAAGLSLRPAAGFFLRPAAGLSPWSAAGLFLFFLVPVLVLFLFLAASCAGLKKEGDGGLPESSFAGPRREGASAGRLLAADGLATPGLSGWTAAGGEWRVEKGALRQEAAAAAIQSLILDGPPVADFRMKAEVRIDGGGVWRSAGLLFRRRDGKNLQHLYLSAARSEGDQKLQYCRIEAGKSAYPMAPGAFFMPVERGRWYRLEILARGRDLNALLDGRPVIAYHDLAPGAGAVGLLTFDCKASFRNFELRELSPGETLFDTVPLLGPLGGKIAPAARSYGELIDLAASFAKKDAGKGPFLPGEEGGKLPPYLFHAVIANDDALSYETSYPAFHHGLFIDWFLRYYVYSGDGDFLRRARQLADWNLAHSTPPDSLYGNLPYSTCRKGKPGGGVDGRTIQPDKAAVMGIAYVKLYQTTGERKYLDGARAVAAALRRTQLPAGNWLFRVDPVTGEAKESFTADVVYPILLFEALEDEAKDRAFEVPKKKALAWLLDGPVRTKEWVGFYEDVKVGARSFGNWITMEAIRYFLEHRRENPSFLDAALKCERYIEERFAAYRGDRGPAIFEQTACYVPMNCHTTHFAVTLAALYKATGREIYRKAAKSAANTATWNIAPDGRTECVDIFNTGSWRSCWYSLAFSQFGLVLEFLEEFPKLAPAGENHLLRHTAPVREIAYGAKSVRYRTAGPGVEVLKVKARPSAVRAGPGPGANLPEVFFRPGIDGAPEISGKGPAFAFDRETMLLAVRHEAPRVEIVLR